MNVKRCAPLLAAVSAILLLTGCGGVTASQSVSPLMFFLPGIGRTTPPPKPPTEKVVPPNQPTELASLRN